MSIDIAAPGAEGSELGSTKRFATTVLAAWRDISPRQWTWTGVIALIVLLANMAGLLPVILSPVPPLYGRQFNLGILVSLGGSIVVFGAALCCLLAVSIVEHPAVRRDSPPRYVAAGLAAWGAAVMLEVGLYVLVPSVSPTIGGIALLIDGRQLLVRIVWSAANIGLSGGLALAVYMSFQSARRVRDAFNSAELERVAASREVLASRLAAMQAQVEPQFLLGTLAQVETLYERDAKAGDRMLDGLIEYLHAALPQLRSWSSTLSQEIRLAESYLRIVQIRMGSRLEYRIGVAPDLGDHHFPPMVVLPLIDETLRNGLEPLPLGGTIAITADASGDRIRVRIADNGLSRAGAAVDSSAIGALRERLIGLYGPAASLEMTNLAQGTVATVEVPRDPARDHR
jgi:hypothetical protein